jgi:small subunit ribosomal protein S17
MDKTRGLMKTLDGTVVTSKMNKTIVVEVSRKCKHPQYNKYITKFSKYYAHDEKNEAKVGDNVQIASCRPLSKTKRWRLLSVTRKAAEL